MTAESIVRQRTVLESLVYQGNVAAETLREIQELCSHPSTAKTTTTDTVGWATDTCGICHKKRIYIVAEIAQKSIDPMML